ncbi:MAG: phosphodiester glycosidase family protein [Clostridia bacterium]|nr:phosphodiester glycosidase family protein [Clostridia bacterium]
MKKLITALFTVLMLTCLATSVFAKESVWQESRKVSFSGGSRTVTAVYVDLKDKTIRMESVAAKNQIGQVDDLKNIATQANNEDRTAVAAINGTFFNAYTDMQPWSTIQSKGEFIHTGNTGSVIAFTADNTVVVDNLFTSVNGSTNGSWQYPNNWYAWGLNHKYNDANSIVVYTPALGKTTGKHNMTSIVVDQGIVIDIRKGEAPIPALGYTLVLNNSELIKRFRKGAAADYKLEFNRINFAGGISKGVSINWDNIRTTVGAGPTLLKNGKILADGKLEGFKEDKINIIRAQRSFAGVTKDSVLIMGTVPDVTVKELAQIAKNLGVINGINLDGGASSGLYFKGKYITQPGRKLSNALVVTKLKQQPLRLQLNGKEVFCETDPYLTGSQNIVMLPLKGICKTIGASMNINNQSKTIIITKRNIKLELILGSDSAKINGIAKKLKAPVTSKYGTIYVPLDLLTETFGGNVKLDTAKKIAVVSLNIPDINKLLEQAKQAEKDGNIEKAASFYLSVLALEPQHGDSHLQLAQIYNKQKDYSKAAQHLAKYVSLNPDDISVLGQLGWAYYNLKDFSNAAAVFKKVTEKKPDMPSSWINLGTVYIHFSVQEYEKAKQCFNTALKLNPTKEQIQSIQKNLDYIASLGK